MNLLLELIHVKRHLIPKYGRQISTEGITTQELEFEAEFADGVEPLLVALYEAALPSLNNQLPEDGESITQILVTILLASAAAAALLAFLKEMLLKAYNLGGQLALIEMGLGDLEFDLTDQSVIDQIDDYAEQVLETLVVTTAGDLAKQVENGRSNGLTIAAIVAGLGTFIALRSAFRANIIAQHESVSGSRWGMEDAYRRNNVLEVVFNTQGDERVDNGDPFGPCVIREGQIYPINNIPVGSRIPLHFGCVIGETEVSYIGNLVGASKRWATGQVIVVTTSRNNRLTVTPNHPILTDMGWVPANGLKVGDNVICGNVIDGKIARSQDMQNRPPLVKDVVSAFFESGKVGTIEVPVSPQDFHGDGADSEVAVVGSDCLLGNGGKAAIFEKFSKLSFPIANFVVGALLFLGFGELYSFLHGCLPATHGFVGRLCERLFLFVRHLTHTDIVSLAPVSQLYPTGSKAFGNRGASDTKPLGQGKKRHAFTIKPHKLIGVKMANSRAFVNFNIIFNQNTSDDAEVNTNLFRNIVNGAFGEVLSDNVISIEVRDFSGHVYNLHTEHGFYAANGIITHNCRCYFIPVLDGWVVPDVVWLG